MRTSIIFLILLAHFCLNAQKALQIGVKIGINFPSIFSYDKFENNFDMHSDNKKQTFAPAIMLNWALNKRWTLRTELLYEERGWIYRESHYNLLTNQYESGYRNYIYKFITQPIIIQHNININKTKLFFTTGLNLSYSIGGGTKENIDYWLGVRNIINPTYYNRGFDIGVTGGGGIEIPIYKKFNLIAESRYYQSISNVGYDIKLYHKGILVQIGILYNLGV